MPNFKPKPVKIIKNCDKYNTTLDIKHKENLSEFKRNECVVIPKLKNDKEELKKKILNNNLTIDEIMEIKDSIKQINGTIRSLNSKKKKYLLDNSKYVFDYFENKQNIDKYENLNGNNPLNTKIIGEKNREIYNFFKIEHTSMTNNHDNTFIDNKNNILGKNENIVHKYMCNVNESILDINLYTFASDVCQHCHKGELVPLESEGLLICNICSIYAPYLVENDKHSYKEPPKEICFYAYKKINHFKEILAQFQGKETTHIDDELIEKINQQIKKERISLEYMTYNKMKDILKILGLNKYYEHIAYIKNKLGIKPPIFTTEFETTLCNLFVDIQAPYSRVCPDYRVNFLNYYYILYKLCELLDSPQYLKDIPMLKDPEKIIEQDEIWKKICYELEWEFVRTV